VDITYRGNLPPEIVDRISRLSPTRRAEVKRAHIYAGSDPNVDDFLRHLDGDPEINALFLDPEIRAGLLAETAGQGYKVVETPISAKTGARLTPQFVADTPAYYEGAEQDIIDLYSLQRELDREQSGVLVERDRNSREWQQLNQFVRAQAPGSVKKVSKGGIENIEDSVYGTRSKHPDLPELTYENALMNATDQLYDNLYGNPYGEQPSGMMMRTGKVTGIPVEHILPFLGNEKLGYDPDNRMMGSTYKNSVLRAEKDPKRRQVLLLSNIAKKEQDIVDKYGKTATQLANEMDYSYIPLGKTRMAEEGLPPSIRKLVSDRSGAIQQADQISDSQGQIIGQKPLVINADKGSKVFVHTNGNGNGKGHAQVQRAFNEANGSNGKPRRRG
tara:strand:+ start:73 stop:1233 length:1161 start_codon:yes stop_codon:yes gene_type:complete